MHFQYFDFDINLLWNCLMDFLVTKLKFVVFCAVMVQRFVYIKILSNFLCLHKIDLTTSTLAYFIRNNIFL